MWIKSKKCTQKDKKYQKAAQNRSFEAAFCVSPSQEYSTMEIKNDLWQTFLHCTQQNLADALQIAVNFRRFQPKFLYIFSSDYFPRIRSILDAEHSIKQHPLHSKLRFAPNVVVLFGRPRRHHGLYRFYGKNFDISPCAGRLRVKIA